MGRSLTLSLGQLRLHYLRRQFQTGFRKPQPIHEHSVALFYALDGRLLVGLHLVKT